MRKNIFFIFTFFYSLALADTPKWYIKKPDNTNIVIYGVGEGNNKNEAINSALYNISKELLVSIDAKTTSEQVEENKNYVDSFRVQIEEKVPQLNFPKYVVVENTKEKNVFYVLLSVNRKELFDLQLSDLEDFKKKLSEQREIISSLNDFAKVDVYGQKIFNLVSQMVEKITVIKCIGYFNDSEYTNLFNKLETEYTTLRNNLNLNILLENPKLKAVEKEINGFFIEKQIKIDENSKNLLIINLENRQDSIYGNYVINSNLTFTLKDNGKTVKYSSKNFSCTSGVSYSKCFDEILKDIKQYIGEKNENFF